MRRSKSVSRHNDDGYETLRHLLLRLLIALNAAPGDFERLSDLTDLEAVVETNLCFLGREVVPIAPHSNCTPRSDPVDLSLITSYWYFRTLRVAIQNVLREILYLNNNTHYPPRLTPHFECCLMSTLALTVECERAIFPEQEIYVEFE